MTFFLMHAIPGDPFIGDHVIDEEVLEVFYTQYGLDKPLWVQYLIYLQRIFCLDLGYSISYPGIRISEMIRDSFPISALLGGQALFLSIGLGICLGLYSTLKRTKWQDTLILTILAAIISIPHFVLATLLQWTCSVRLGWLPLASWGTFSHTILPTLSLAALPTAIIARLIRTSMIKVLEEGYILTAKAKGLSSRQIILNHGLKNALLPVITYLGPLTAHMITGSLVIERIFSIPGLGKWMVYSITMRDYPMILGLTLFFSFFLMFSIFIIDIIYGLVDPRIRWS